MKKLLTYALAACAMGALATSCSSDEPVATGQSGSVTFTVNLPGEISSRAFSDGKSALNLTCMVFQKDASGSYTPVQNVDGQNFVDLKSSVEIEMAKGVDYKIIFWGYNDAQTEFGTNTSKAYNWASDGTLTVNYGAMKSYSENYDAFYAVVDAPNATVSSNQVTLYRPFAQLNVGTSDLGSKAVETKYGSPVNIYTTVAVKGLLTQWNPMTDANDYANQQNVTTTFTSAAMPAGENFHVTGYSYLAMNYLLVGTPSQAQASHEVTLNFGNAATANISGDVKLGPVPFQSNYQTNVYGSLLINSTKFTVTINPAFTGTLPKKWDGKTATAPDFSGVTVTGTGRATKADGVVYINTPEELAGLAGIFNGTVPLPAGITAEALRNVNNRGIEYRLGFDLDMDNKAWTPISRFQGTLNGNGHTIANLKVNVAGNAGLLNVSLNNNDTGFSSNNAQVENLTVTNANITSTGTGTANATASTAGVIAGMSTYINVIGCTVKDCTVTGHYKVGGIIGGLYGQVRNCTVENCTINCTYVNDDQNGKNCGGIVGFVGEGNEAITNNTVIGGTINAYLYCGGIAGTIYNGTTFTGNRVQQLNGTNLVINNTNTLSAAEAKIGAIYGRIAIDGTNQGAKQDNQSNYVTIQ